MGSGGHHLPQLLSGAVGYLKEMCGGKKREIEGKI
jgi:hypothetical protein